MKKKSKTSTKTAKKSPADFVLPFLNKHACGCIKLKTKLCKEHSRA